MVPLYFAHRFGDESLVFSKIFAIIVFAILFLPQLLLHVKYWLANRDVEISFDVQKKSFTYKKGQSLTEVKQQDIDKVTTVVSYPAFSRASRWFPWDSYGYSIISLKTGTDLIVTTLLLQELVWPFALPREEIKPSLYCWI